MASHLAIHSYVGAQRPIKVKAKGIVRVGKWKRVLPSISAFLVKVTQLHFNFLPGVDSWVRCTHYSKECDGECIGCDLDTQRNESFPIFPALLNAVHQKGVKVRLITNNYTQPTCWDKITPLDWFYLNGMDIRFYTTTTFMHSKFVNVDGGKRVSVSSVNWSKTSFTKNREAGVVLEDCSCSAVDLYASVFEYDWSRATEYVIAQTYTDPEMKFITDPADMAIQVPPPPYIPGAYVTSLETFDGVSIKKAYTSPDNARDVMMSYFPEVKSSLQVRKLLTVTLVHVYSMWDEPISSVFHTHTTHTHAQQIMIYQITDAGLCNATMKLWEQGINVTVLVSNRIVSYLDWKRAQVRDIEAFAWVR